MYDYVLAIDPSGNFNEGKGHTGFCLYNTLTKTFEIIDEVAAKYFNSSTAYWDAVCAHLSVMTYGCLINVIVVIEDYLLYGDKAASQTNSRLETPQLIGVLKHRCAQLGLPYKMQTASEIKHRWADSILLWKGLITKRGSCYIGPLGNAVSNHERDAMRHAIHFASFKNKEKQ